LLAVWPLADFAAKSDWAARDARWSSGVGGRWQPAGLVRRVVAQEPPGMRRPGRRARQDPTRKPWFGPAPPFTTANRLPSW